MKPQINVGLIGHGFMGKAHSHALHDLTFFIDVPYEPVRHTLCGIGEDLERAANRYGWHSTTEDWRQVVDNPAIHAISICAPGNMHREIAVAASQAGKHVLCEKPLANSASEAQAMLDAATAAGVRHAVNFNYRKLPAVALARHFIESGSIGEVRFFRATYFQDWTLDPAFPFVWRFDKTVAGAGSMADKGSHVVDLARYLVGEFAEVAAASAIFIPERSGKQVTTDDAAAFLCRFHSGALGIFGTNRMSAGHKNALGFEVNGSRGSLIFDLERLNELQVYFAEDGPAAGFRTVLATDSAHHPYARHWWPPGHIIGWEHSFVHQYLDFFSAIASQQDASPSFADGCRAQIVLDAVESAANSKSWVSV
jgi:predicted dehydrogenase